MSMVIHAEIDKKMRELQTQASQTLTGLFSVFKKEPISHLMNAAEDNLKGCSWKTGVATGVIFCSFKN